MGPASRRFLLVTVISLLSMTVNLTTARAQSSRDENLAYISASGSFVATQPGSSYDNATVKADKGVGGGLDFGYRFGSFALETGVHMVKQAWIATYQNGAAPYHELINYGYVGVPFVAKWNYIESRLATFFVKGGASLNFASSRSNEDLIPVQFVSGLAGIGGTSELGEQFAFLLDICATQHFGFDTQPPVDAIISAGFLVAL